MRSTSGKDQGRTNGASSRRRSGETKRRIIGVALLAGLFAASPVGAVPAKADHTSGEQCSLLAYLVYGCPQDFGWVEHATDPETYSTWLSEQLPEPTPSPEPSTEPQPSPEPTKPGNGPKKR